MGSVTLRIASLAGALAAALAAPVAAQPAESDADAAARELFLAGESFYAEGRYEQAVAKYEDAHELSARPLLLFNIANAYERLGEYRQAAEALRRYLPDARPEESTVLRKRVARLDERAGERDRDRRELAQLRAKQCPACPAVPPAALELAPPRQPSRTLGAALLGVGVVAVSTGTVFGVVARGAHADAEAACRGGGLCPSSVQSDIDRERTFALLADISVGVGVVAMAGGVYALLRANASGADARDDRRTVIAPTGGANWAGVGVAGSF